MVLPESREDFSEESINGPNSNVKKRRLNFQ